MEELTRREALRLAAAGTMATEIGVRTASGDKNAKADQEAKFLKADRERVIAAGMTEAEADCWEVTARAAGKFFELPKLHPMDDHEVAHAIHIIQHKLLSRPTYRKYLELAKAAAGK